MAAGDWGAGLNDDRNVLCAWTSYDDSDSGLIIEDILEYNKTNFIFKNGGANGRKQLAWGKFKLLLCNNEVYDRIKGKKINTKDSKKIYG